jgi:hypothetical protein
MRCVPNVRTSWMLNLGVRIIMTLPGSFSAHSPWIQGMFSPRFSSTPYFIYVAYRLPRSAWPSVMHCSLRQLNLTLSGSKDSLQTSHVSACC